MSVIKTSLEFIMTLNQNGEFFMLSPETEPPTSPSVAKMIGLTTVSLLLFAVHHVWPRPSIYMN